MESGFKTNMVIDLIRLHKIMMRFSERADVHMGELMILKYLSGDNLCLRGERMYVSDICADVNISKPGVSQVLNTLESKGYITRSIDQTDRRKIVVALTDAGKSTVKNSMKNVDMIVSDITKRFGEAKTAQLTALFSEFTDLAESTIGEQPERN